MLLPKRVKYRRVMRGRMKGKATRGNVVSHGEFGLQALEPAWITSRQIEAANLHNAVMHIEDETIDDNTVVEDLMKGYIYKDGRVVRHSMVKVAN